jgi:histidinol-phosphate aminotransferase
MALLHRVRQPFNVNAVAQAAAAAALDDLEFVEMCRTENEAGRRVLCEGLVALGFGAIGGSANFVLSCVGNGVAVFEALQRHGIIVRPLAPYGMPEYVRISIGRSDENERLLSTLSELLESGEVVKAR